MDLSDSPSEYDVIRWRPSELSGQRVAISSALTGRLNRAVSVALFISEAIGYKAGVKWTSLTHRP